MIPKKWHIRLDMQKQYDNEIIEMVRQDTYSNELMIHLVQSGSVVNFTDTVLVAIIFDKSDGSQVIGSCEILQNGLVRYIVDYQALTSLGITTVTLKLIDAEMVETSTSFIINVIADPFSGAGSVVSASEYPILTQTILDNQAIKTILQGWLNDPSQFIGPEGPIGPQGNKGDTGLTGPRGLQGERGLQGIEGNVGPRGLIGETGPKGDTGSKGDKGDTGSKGATGDIGPRGFIGPEGQQGIQGLRGPEGLQGIQGLKGDTGAKGDQGIQGIQGPKGDKGDKGDTGDKGLTGDTGAGLNILGALNNPTELPSSGSTGDGYLIDGNLWVWNGIEFEDVGNIQGPQGEQGIQGIQGVPGLDGKNLEFNWSGTQLGVRVEGQATYQYINLQGPKGDKGEQGIQGIQGEQGEQGPKGEDGYTPIKGVDYFDGAKGDKGDKGDTGNPGSDANVTNANVIAAIGYTPVNTTDPRLSDARPADGGNANTVGGFTVGVNVPANAKFTDNDTITTVNGKTGAISKADIVALGIPAQDTVYTHPANHPPSIISQDANNRFVTDTEKANWNGKSNFSGSYNDLSNKPTIPDTSTLMPISGGVLENYREKLVTLSGTSTAINLSLGNVFTHTLSGNTTYSITNAVSGQAHSFTLIITQTATVRTLTFPASVNWQGGEIPDLSTTNKTYVLTFMIVNGGVNWLGMFGGMF